jgi:hypothetical protein
LAYLELTNNPFGEAVEFNNTGEDGGVDEISEGLHITRGNVGWLYNPLEESESGENTPTNSLWNNDGWNDLTDIEDREYVSLATIWQYNFRSIVGAEMVMLDTTTDKYYAVKITRWSRDEEGFSYVRYELDLTQLQEGVKFADGTTLKSAAGLGKVKAEFTGERRIVEETGYVEVSADGVEEITSASGTTAEKQGNPWDVYLLTSENSAIETLRAEYGRYSDVSGKWQLEVNGSIYSNNVEVYVEGDFILIYSGSQNNDINYGEGTTVVLRRMTNPQPVKWFEASGGNFRGAIIEYHAYSQDAGTIIGTIWIARDAGDENISHIETASGGGDISNVDLWFRDSDEGNERQIYFRRLDGESDTVKIQWIAKLFYGNEYYD